MKVRSFYLGLMATVSMATCKTTEQKRSQEVYTTVFKGLENSTLSPYRNTAYGGSHPACKRLVIAAYNQMIETGLLTRGAFSEIIEGEMSKAKSMSMSRIPYLQGKYDLGGVSNMFNLLEQTQVINYMGSFDSRIDDTYNAFKHILTTGIDKNIFSPFETIPFSQAAAQLLYSLDTVIEQLRNKGVKTDKLTSSIRLAFQDLSKASKLCNAKCGVARDFISSKGQKTENFGSRYAEHVYNMIFTDTTFLNDLKRYIDDFNSQITLILDEIAVIVKVDEDPELAARLGVIVRCCYFLDAVLQTLISCEHAKKTDKLASYVSWKCWMNWMRISACEVSNHFSNLAVELYIFAFDGDRDYYQGVVQFLTAENLTWWVKNNVNGFSAFRKFGKASEDNLYIHANDYLENLYSELNHKFAPSDFDDAYFNEVEHNTEKLEKCIALIQKSDLKLLLLTSLNSLKEKLDLAKKKLNYHGCHQREDYHNSDYYGYYQEVIPSAPPAPLDDYPAYPPPPYDPGYLVHPMYN